NSFSVLGFGSIVSLPVSFGLRRVAGPAIRALPTLGVYVLASAKQRPKQGDLLRCVERRPPRSRLLPCVDWRCNRKSNTVFDKERAKPLVLVFEPPTLLRECPYIDGGL